MIGFIEAGGIGKNKQQKQIEKDRKSFNIKDDIEFALVNLLSPWAFGFN